MVINDAEELAGQIPAVLAARTRLDFTAASVAADA
jgi:hypothetical protein